MNNHNVLFLCVGNSARSQMAEALLKAAAGDRFDVFSAGTEPKQIHPLTIEVLDEIGIDIRDYRSKGLKEFLGRISARYVIILCEEADDRCPKIWPGMMYRLLWPFQDPAECQGTKEARLAKFRLVRDQIQEKIAAWLEEVDNS